ncbi:hypothetical protein HPB47_021009 [Ixodes persulcatus]|uniref:Uncharacterized protein n=1 Tax=Ixodes persulcatus TaxID=34615 RepID=A0AC60QG04_IXOPE|nr:hypothetical protein HPB47_021009 [Ixodes persulcatus]
MVREARVRDVAGMLAPQIQAVALEVETTLLDCSGASAQKIRVVQRGPAPLKVAVATQTSFPDARKPLLSPTPQLKL